MKKLLLSLIVVLGLATTANAQEVGKIWVGGNVGFTSSKVKDGDKTTEYAIIPEVGYVFSDKMAIALNVGYNHSKTGDVKTNGYEVSPFIRYSALKGSIGGVFIDGGVGYRHNKAGDLKTNTFEVGFRPGVSINISEKVALTSTFGLLGYRNTKAGDTKVNTFGFDLGNTMRFGFNYIF